jgi:hypothetical protein
MRYFTPVAALRLGGEELVEVEVLTVEVLKLVVAVLAKVLFVVVTGGTDVAVLAGVAGPGTHWSCTD